MNPRDGRVNQYCRDNSHLLFKRKLLQPSHCIQSLTLPGKLFKRKVVCLPKLVEISIGLVVSGDSRNSVCVSDNSRVQWERGLSIEATSTREIYVQLRDRGIVGGNPG